MLLKDWDNLPESMKTDEVKKYYVILSKKKIELLFKRIFDFVVALGLMIILFIPMVVISIIIAIDSPGGIFYRQARVTTYGKIFNIHKFRTMVIDADKIGGYITVGQDKRITKIGKFLRKYRLDELPQIIDILQGNMSFVGTRPEVPEFVAKYTNEMFATLLLPAGVTSEASIRYKDEADILGGAKDTSHLYTTVVLPEKMKYNLKAIEEFNLWSDLFTMIRTILAVCGREYS